MTHENTRADRTTLQIGAATVVVLAGAYLAVSHGRSGDTLGVVLAILQIAAGALLIAGALRQRRANRR
ncbi:hypothetical protein [Litorihabitans aurantiacus]|uniref:Uncharacterized protein n=1 Tax=Litorihabitans aurantiacus TaxID=1930061 RepID=A0AA38CV61_9MICO|nr:hypothetical protein [Litorihabitans aurantiacus]GMA32470.1 hypothetical protein GCM10025875_24620 [Litorihabitans aurantiacus]